MTQLVRLWVVVVVPPLLKREHQTKHQQLRSCLTKK
jgi:hypothetical protein